MSAYNQFLEKCQSFFVYERLKIKIKGHFLANTQLAGNIFCEHPAIAKKFLIFKRFL
jgi:hypothetical protein